MRSSNSLKIQFSNVAMQTNSNDCGLYAIANATALAYGKDPTTQIYIPKLMRQHLFTCLENKHLTPFPTTNSKRRRQPVKAEKDVPLYCVCKMPDTNTVYVFCDICGHEFHPECVKITREVTDSMEFTCPNCLNK